MTDGEWGAEERRRRRAASWWPCPTIVLGVLAVLTAAVLEVAAAVRTLAPDQPAEVGNE
jgi:hypothetical protein